MLITILKSKIHKAHITDKNLNYEGSIVIDKSLMQAANIIPFERVEVFDINNGARFDTYAIEGDRGVISVNGAAARLVEKDDILIIIAYCQVEPYIELKPEPYIIYVDQFNEVSSLSLV
jgi:aspartate 1-decarboxylase